MDNTVVHCHCCPAILLRVPKLVSPQMWSYTKKGHANGVKLYCTPRNGLSKGRQNAQYHDVCPKDLEAPFLSSFIDGLELNLFWAEQEKADAESRLYRLRRVRTAHDGSAPRDLIRQLREQESAVSRYSSQELSLKLRISQLRLKVNAATR